ncbi:hypothetical protein [Flavobacterium poyangense]|uniref:hypothetical protein n=1 Tax=Flavobacterium poyangense TaxID=2204302 RepID=UPI00141E4015|nr:hypothetical protein [Flavobacterium sp. JXAS1]
MDNRTEIGKIIKSKLAELDKTPSDFVWSKIETDLNKKRKRRMIYWAIPAIIAAFLFSTSLYVFSNFQDTKQRQEANKTKESQSKKVKTDQNSDPKSTLVQIQQKSEPDETTTIKRSKTIKLVKQSSKLITTTKEYKEYEVVKKYKVIVRTNHVVTKPVTPITANKKQKREVNKSLAVVGKVTQPSKKVSKKTPKALKSGNNKKTEKKSTAVEIPLIKTDTEDPLKNTTPSEPLQIETKIDTVPKTDTLNLKKKTKKREYKKTDYKNTKEDLHPDFTLSVLYGPALFGSLNSKSLISPTMDDLDKTHPITSHYGIYLKTMFNRIGFRTGFSKINLKITTRLDQNVLISNYDNIILKNQINTKELFKGSENVDLLQKLSYYEFPMEFYYAVKKDESKIAIDTFTGFSFLFLDKNELYMKSEKVSRQTIGEVKNISGVNISYDLGLELSYKLTDRFTLGINPIFKYYLSTFKENAEAKPYSFSLQSGIGYKF